MSIDSSFRKSVDANFPHSVEADSLVAMSLPPESDLSPNVQLETPLITAFDLLDQTTLKTERQGEALIRFNKRQSSILLNRTMLLIALVVVTAVGVALAPVPGLLVPGLATLMFGAEACLFAVIELKNRKSKTHAEKMESEIKLFSDPNRIFYFININVLTHNQTNNYGTAQNCQHEGIISKKFADSINRLSSKLKDYHDSIQPNESIHAIHEQWIKTYKENLFDVDLPQLQKDEG